MADTRLDALRRSVERLQSIAADLTDEELVRRAYPAEWTIADVLSHLGSGAVITERRVEDILAGRNTPDEFAPAVWADWNAKTPEAKRTDSLAADAHLLAALDALDPAERDNFAFSMGPIDVDFDGFVGLRLNEHALHTWDIDVALDATATIPDDIAAHVVDNLDLIARFTAKPNGDTTTLTVATPDGLHGLTVELTPDSAEAATGTPTTSPQVALDAESLVRLVYGRLDPGHTPPGQSSPLLDTLRRVFPGP